MVHAGRRSCAFSVEKTTTVTVEQSTRKCRKILLESADLRHTHAAMGLAASIPEKVMSDGWGRLWGSGVTKPGP
jgi:hypothetical protein